MPAPLPLYGVFAALPGRRQPEDETGSHPEKHSWMAAGNTVCSASLSVHLSKSPQSGIPGWVGSQEPPLAASVKSGKAREAVGTILSRSGPVLRWPWKGSSLSFPERKAQRTEAAGGERRGGAAHVAVRPRLVRLPELEPQLHMPRSVMSAAGWQAGILEIPEACRAPPTFPLSFPKPHRSWRLLASHFTSWCSFWCSGFLRFTPASRSRKWGVARKTF